ncbi:S-layer homology domain-containing protein [Paenibacillus sp. CAU 1782]
MKMKRFAVVGMLCFTLVFNLGVKPISAEAVIDDALKKVYDIAMPANGNFVNLEASYRKYNGVDYFSARTGGGPGGREPVISVYGLNPETGKKMFVTSFYDNSFGQYAGATHEYIGRSYSNGIYSFFSIGSNGKSLWEAKIPANPSLDRIPTLGQDGYPYHYDHGSKPINRVYKYSHTGKLLWEYTYTQAELELSAVIGGTNGESALLFTGASAKWNGKMLVLDKNGKTKYEYSIGKSSDFATEMQWGQMFSNDGTISLITVDVSNGSDFAKTLTVLDSKGELLWSEKIGSLYDVKWGSNGTLYVKTRVLNNDKGYPLLLAYDKKGNKKWSFQREYYRYNQSTVDDSHITVSDFNSIYFDGVELDLNGKLLRYFLAENYLNTYTQTRMAPDGTLFLFKSGPYDSMLGIAKYKLKFPDIQQHWAREDIMTLIQSEIVTGNDDGTFKPEGVVTREQFVTMLVKTLGTGTPVKTSGFSDVAQNRWSAPYIDAATQAGIISTKEYGSTFNPSQAITRQEIAVMAAKALNLSENASAADVFTDTNGISNKGWVGAAIGAGIISGMPDGTFSGSQTATRAQAAAIIVRMTRH